MAPPLLGSARLRHSSRLVNESLDAQLRTNACWLPSCADCVHFISSPDWPMSRGQFRLDDNPVSVPGRPVVSCRAVSCRYVTDATCFTAVLPRLGFYHKNCSGIFLVWFLHIWGLIVILIKPYALFYYEHFSYRPTLCLKNVQSLTGYSFNIHTPIF